MKARLHKAMTLAEFDNGYWYATEIKQFAKTLGIVSSASLRKDELGKAIKLFLKTGKIKSPTNRKLSKSGIKDVELGLSLQLPVVNYTSNKATKDFIVKEALKIAPGLKRKSGARYRLYRWREAQLTQGVKLTYADLIRHYVKLNQTEARFAKIPYDCYINFLSDFLAAEKTASREKAMQAWHQLKAMDVPKNYRAWKKSQ
jgi:hypothetical protein